MSDYIRVAVNTLQLHSMGFEASGVLALWQALYCEPFSSRLLWHNDLNNMSESENVAAGQAVIQFATHQLSKLEYAIKFFASCAAFHDEVAQYTDTSSPLHQFLPQGSGCCGQR